MLGEGLDPSLAKRENRQVAEANAANTFEAVAREWHERSRERMDPTLCPRHPASAGTADIFPSVGKQPVADISPLVMLKALRKIENRGAGEMARRAAQYCGPDIPVCRRDGPGRAQPHHGSSKVRSNRLSIGISRRWSPKTCRSF